ncbi:unnamed protein product, partial [Candidula unifasciata]
MMPGHSNNNNISIGAMPSSSSSSANSGGHLHSIGQENAILIPLIQRVMSPSDCTVSQSTLKSPTYMDTSNNTDDDQSLHSTMQESGVITSAEVVMDSALDSSDLTTLHPVAMETREMVNCQNAAVSS